MRLGSFRCKVGLLVREAVVDRVSWVHVEDAVWLTVAREVVGLGGDQAVAVMAVDRDENAVGVGHAEEAMVVRQAPGVGSHAAVVDHACRCVDVHDVEDVDWCVGDRLAHDGHHRTLEEGEAHKRAESPPGRRCSVVR